MAAISRQTGQDTQLGPEPPNEVFAEMKGADSQDCPATQPVPDSQEYVANELDADVAPQAGKSMVDQSSVPKASPAAALCEA